MLGFELYLLNYDNMQSVVLACEVNELFWSLNQYSHS